MQAIQVGPLISFVLSKQLTMLGPGLTDPESCLFSCTDWVGVAFSSPLDLSLDVSLGLTY
jgi:hypothetical protein